MALGMPRRLLPPWTFEDSNDACFIVRDKPPRARVCSYCELEPGRRAAANLLTKDEAPRIAANIAKLPELLRRRADRPRTLMRHRDKILWDNANEPLVWAVDIGDKEKRNRYDHWQNHKNEHARSTLAITKQQVGEDRGHSH